jgi:Fe-S cluster biogenesis protein NfuA
MVLVKEEVQKALDEIKGYLEADGGGVELVGIDGTKVKVRLFGACQGCPFSSQTLKHGIEKRIKEKIPEVSEVIAVD